MLGPYLIVYNLSPRNKKIQPFTMEVAIAALLLAVAAAALTNVVLDVGAVTAARHLGCLDLSRALTTCAS